MKICRVVATHRDGGHQNGERKVIIVCGVDETDSLEKNGEWLGYYLAGGITHPFVLKQGSQLFYGWNEHYSEPTNIGSKKIKPQELFTVFDPEDNSEVIYEITTCHFY